MALVQQRYMFVAVALTFVFLLYEFREFSLISQPVPSHINYIPLPKPAGVWSWTNRQIQYPRVNLVDLPSGKSMRLPTVQYRFGGETSSERSTRLERQETVKTTFTKCWQSYRKKAWMMDELSPVSGGGRNRFGGWSATLVDALDTLWIMDMMEEFEEAVTAVISIDFTTSTDETVNVFETTIRYLGGFLAAYDLSNDIRLLHKAVEIGEMLLVPFDTPNHLPITRWRWKDAINGKAQEAASWMLVSELGTFTLEFTRLSQLTGDPRWYDANDRIMRLFDRQQNKTKLPGMWPVVVNAKEADLTGDNGFTLGGMSDSLYEYFPKAYALLGGTEPVYKKLYEESMSTAAENLFFRPMVPDQSDILISGDVHISSSGDGLTPTVDPRGQHLTCFVGGMLALGGRLFENEKHVVMGRKITDGCIWAYNATSVGVMPEIANFLPCLAGDICHWDEGKWKAAVLEQAGIVGTDVNLDDFITSKRLPEGFSQIPDPRYILRPEALESVFIMYRITGDRKYIDSAWQMFSAILHISQTEFANAAVSDITATTDNGLPPKDDSMESFWLAETLKYAYLIFSEPDLISLDEYVLNTEAHPLKRRT